MKRFKITLKDDSQYDKVKDWYLREFPSDPLGTKINPRTTFYAVWTTIYNYGGDIYKELGVSDSVVRERIFREVAKRFGTNYRELYNAWVRDSAITDANIQLLGFKEVKDSAVVDSTLEVRIEPIRNTWVGYENGKPATEEFKTTKTLFEKYPKFKTAKVIDYPIYDGCRMKDYVSHIEQIPVKARNELNNSKNKEATLLGILNDLQQEIDFASENERASIKMKANKILNDLKKQFGLENKTYIKLNDAHGDTMYFINDTETLKASIIEIVNNEVPMITAVTPTRSQTFKTWDGAKRWLENKGYHKVSKEKYFSIKDENAVVNNLMEASKKIVNYSGNDNLTLKVKNTPFLLLIEKSTDDKYAVKIYVSNGAVAQVKSVIVANTLDEAKSYGYTLLEEIKNYKG